MWSDNETGTDLLGFQYLTDAVASIARRPDLLPPTIGVFGDWGSGKSNLLKKRVPLWQPRSNGY
jgi:hypothetical protein